MSNKITDTNYARLAGALEVELTSALAVLGSLSGESPWAKERAERIRELFEEIDDGRFSKQKEVVASKGCPF